jgi:hypothetical protein
VSSAFNLYSTSTEINQKAGWFTVPPHRRDSVRLVIVTHGEFHTTKAAKGPANSTAKEIHVDRSFRFQIEPKPKNLAPSSIRLAGRMFSDFQQRMAVLNNHRLPTGYADISNCGL